MVSALWKACSQGDLQTVNQLLVSPDPVDIEVKDHTGSTPLIEAIKNGNPELVRVLLDKGADPTNASSQGLPETYTSDQNILSMLNDAKNKAFQGANPGNIQENGYTENTTTYTPPENYPYYPTINSAPPPETYYPPPPHSMPLENNGGRNSNLPPPEVASAIPCRYYPACRYGSACIFQHPQGPYFQGPLPPPAPYPTSYEQMPPQPYAPTYYPVPPPSFPPQMNGQPPIPPQQGPPVPMHGQSPPEMMPPPPQGHFSPNGAPSMSYGPISPIMYSHPGQAPIPMSIPPLPPLHHQPPPPPAPQSPQANFNSSSPPSVPSTFPQPQNGVGPYPHVNGNGSVSYPEVNGAAVRSPQLSSQPDIAGPGRDGSGANRRGTARRGSFANRKPTPPCIFFPTGRCKNGTDCRFPHVMPQDGAAAHTPVYPSRGGAPRPQRHANGNGFTVIDEKMANMSLQDNSRNHDSGSRGRGGKPNGHAQPNKKAAPVKQQQRVPNADEFPVLGGTTTPPTRANGAMPNGHVGPTAAQILQAPRPVRPNGTQVSTPRGVTPDRVKELKPEVNGTAEVHASKPPSFAAVATAATDVAVAA